MAVKGFHGQVVGRRYDRWRGDPAANHNRGQRFQRGLHLQRREHLIADRALLCCDVDGLGRIDALAEEAAHHVGEHDSCGYQYRRFFDRPAHRFGAGRAGVDTQEFRRALVDQALAPHQRGMGYHVGGQQCLELVDGIQTMDQEVGQHGQPVVCDEFGCGFGEQSKGPWAGTPGIAWQRCGRPLGFEARDVGGQQKISGPPLLPYLAEHPVDFPGGRRWHEIGLGTGDFPAYPEEVLEIAVAQRMMQSPASALRVFRWPADDVHHRHMLGVTARDRIGRRELADSECGYHS